MEDLVHRLSYYSPAEYTKLSHLRSELDEAPDFLDYSQARVLNLYSGVSEDIGDKK